MHPDWVISSLLSQDEISFVDLLDRAGEIRDRVLGRRVYLRGLIEVSNECSSNCFYCGIRKDNHKLTRYRLDTETIIRLAQLAWEEGYHSICLQSGEIQDPAWVEELIDIVYEIKDLSRKQDPEGKGLGITLSLGELSHEQYLRFYEAGAHRCLLRIESSDPDLFKSLHPPAQSYEKRLACLYDLKSIGYQVGTGIMAGLPGQTADHLLHDLAFFKKLDIDMLGMGPYIQHPDTPLYRSKKPVFLDAYRTTLKMLAICRILMPDINMVASTALQSMHPQGLQMGLNAGANIVMPVLTPEDCREKYMLYTGKNYRSGAELLQAIRSCGYEPGLHTWGDSLHYQKRQEGGQEDE